MIEKIVREEAILVLRSYVRAETSHILASSELQKISDPLELLTYKIVRSISLDVSRECLKEVISEISSDHVKYGLMLEILDQKAIPSSVKSVSKLAVNEILCESLLDDMFKMMIGELSETLCVLVIDEEVEAQQKQDIDTQFQNFLERNVVEFLVELVAERAEKIIDFDAIADSVMAGKTVNMLEDIELYLED